MHNQPYIGRIALCTRKKLLKSGEIRDFYGTLGRFKLFTPNWNIVFRYLPRARITNYIAIELRFSLGSLGGEKNLLGEKNQKKIRAR